MRATGRGLTGGGAAPAGWPVSSGGPGAAARHRAVIQRLRPIWYGAAGFAFGLVVLHPIAMIIFRWFDPRTAAELRPSVAVLFTTLLHSFTPEMAPMGFVFAFFSAAIAVVDGRYRGRVARQRDQLTRQAEELRVRNGRLTRLEQANRRQTLFMVHDFKGHLATISGFSELLLRNSGHGRDDGEVAALMRIRRQSQRMAGAVTDLLELARLGESPALRREPTPVSELLRAAAADLSLPAQGADVEIGPAQSDCPDVSVDTKLIERVLVNLALNAIKHNRPGVHVVVDAEPTSAGNVTFSVSDDGQGLSKEAQAVLFEEFADRGDPHDSASTGLGLAFCKAAVEAHGGRIWCDSVPGQGACLSFTVPRRKDGVER